SMYVVIFEGALHIQSRNYRRMKQLVQNEIKDSEQPFLGANFNFGQYSSKYMQYRDAMDNHQIAPNVFNLEYSGGALMDLGVYPVYVVLIYLVYLNQCATTLKKGKMVSIFSVQFYSHMINFKYRYLSLKQCIQNCQVKFM